ncbi:MAG: hypothetical protein SPG64_01310 [Candidatus Enteromonas sp.]|nr:hypothetical protein [Candidatus Enteromonas sp.]
MKEIELALETLADVFEGGMTFTESLKKRFQSNLEIRPYRVNVAALVGCELRHHLLFRFLQKEQSFPEGDRRLVSLALANHYFNKRISDEAFDAYLSEHASMEACEFVRSVFSTHTAESLIPEDISRSSNLFLSLRYNFPEWTLKIFQHFGFGPTYRTVKSLSRPAKRYYALANGATVAGTCTNSEFVPAPYFPEEMVEYVGKTSIVKNPVYREGNLYSVKPFGHHLLRTFVVEHPSQILIYDGTTSAHMARDLIEIYGSSIGINIALPSVNAAPEITRAIRQEKLVNVNLFSAPAGEGMGSAVSVPQELVLCCPESTEFDNIPYSPDYLIRFDKSRMDAIFDNQKRALESCSKFVEVGGLLIYCVFTISKKEGSSLMAAFLSEHREFERVESKQHFPSEDASLHNACFYCVLRKKESELTATPVTPMVGALAREGNSVASAEGK